MLKARPATVGVGRVTRGDGMLWHAPDSGSVVSLEPIWTDSVFYGRVL